MTVSPSVRVSCSRCGTSRVAPLPAILRELGMLRRNREIDVEMMWQLLQGAQTRLTCDQCSSVGLRCEQVADDEEKWDWPSVPECRICRGPIPPERLELFPDAKHCATCQQTLERKAESSDREFCPRCGTVLAVRASRSAGISRYEMSCSSCGFRGG